MGVSAASVPSRSSQTKLAPRQRATSKTPGSTGYAAAGYLGGVVTARHIRSLRVGPASSFAQTAQNPAFVQRRERGFPAYQTAPGYALTNVAITTAKSIDHASITGSLQNSEIKTGFNYPSYIAGLEGTRARSQIGHLRVAGSLVNSVVSATVRPLNGHYQRRTNVKGPGKITGVVTGRAIDTGAATALNNTGAGVYARFKRGRLPSIV